MSALRLGLQPDGSVMLAISPDTDSPAYEELARALGPLPETAQGSGRWRIYSVRPRLLRAGAVGFTTFEANVDLSVGVADVDPQQVCELPPAWQAWIAAQASAMRADIGAELVSVRQGRRPVTTRTWDEAEAEGLTWEQAEQRGDRWSDDEPAPVDPMADTQRDGEPPALPSFDDGAWGPTVDAPHVRIPK